MRNESETTTIENSPRYFRRGRKRAPRNNIHIPVRDARPCPRTLVHYTRTHACITHAHALSDDGHTRYAYAPTTSSRHQSESGWADIQGSGGARITHAYISNHQSTSFPRRLQHLHIRTRACVSRGRWRRIIFG